MKTENCVEQVYLQVSGGLKTKEISKDDYLRCGMTMSKMNPLQVYNWPQNIAVVIFQVDILFSLSDRLHNSKTLIYSDLQSLAPEQYMKQVTSFPSIQFQGDEASGGHQAGRSARGQELGDCHAGVQLQVLQ